MPLQQDVEGLLSEVEAFFLAVDRFFLLEGVAVVEVSLTFDKATIHASSRKLDQSYLFFA